MDAHSSNVNRAGGYGEGVGELGVGATFLKMFVGAFADMLVMSHRQRPSPDSFPSPVALEDVRYELGPGTHRSTEVANALQTVWSSSSGGPAARPFILYATVLKESQAQRGNMWFTKKFSLSVLPEPDDGGIVPLTMVFAGSGLAHSGRMAKRRDDRIARITHGWKGFAKAHELKAGSVYLFSFRKTPAQQGRRLGLVV